MWRTASQSSRGDYAEEALLERQRKAANIAHETRILREELVARRAAMLEQKRERGCTGLVDDTRLTQAELEELQTMYDSPEFSARHVPRWFQDAEDGSPLLDKDERAAIRLMPFHRDPHLVKAAPPWLSPLAALRDQITNLIIRFGSAEDSPAFLWLFGKLQPLECSLLPLVRSEPVELPVHLGFSVCQAAAACLWHRYSYHVIDGSDYHYEFMFDPVTMDEMFVFTGVVEVSPSIFGTNVDPLPYEDFVLSFGIDARARSASEPRQRSRYDSPELAFRDDAEHPWLSAWREKAAGHRARTVPRAKRIPRPALHELDDDELELLHAELDALRAEWVENNRDEAKALAHCRVHHFGGTWTAVHVGSVCDKVGGVPCTIAAKNMFRRWSLNREFGNSVELYGLENARLLAYAWCHRISYFTRIWTKAGETEDFEFTVEHANDYVEPDSVTAAVTKWAHGSEPLRRLQVCRLATPMGKGE